MPKKIVTSHVRAGGRGQGRANVLAAPARQGVFDLRTRDWQADCFTKLRNRRTASRIKLKAPTASGKTTVLKALSWVDVNAGHQSIIAVPQHIVGGSFTRGGKSTLVLPNGQEVTWEVSEALLGVSDTIERASRWLQSKKPGILLTTHQTLSILYSRLEASKKLSLLKDVSVYVDEAHHLRTDETAEKEDLANKIGACIRWLARHGTGRIVLASATWMRRDLGQILPVDITWVMYEYRIEDYLADLKFLKNIYIRFLSLSLGEAVGQALEGGAKHLIAYLPPVNSRHARGRHKQEHVNEILDVLGAHTEDGGVRHHRRGSRALRSVDLVTEHGRDGADGRKSVLLKLIEDQLDPEVVITLKIGIEGYDQPSLDHGVLDGPRDSLQQVGQVLGRLLRDYEGKESIYLDIVVDPELANSTEGYGEFIRVLTLALVLDWALQPPRLNDDDIDIDKLGSDLSKALVRDPVGAAKDPAGLVKGILDKLGQKPAAEADVAAIVRRLHDFSHHIISQTTSEVSPDVQGSPIRGMLDSMSTHLTSMTFRELRVKLKLGLDLDEREVRTAIKRHRRETGKWPAISNKPVPGHEGVVWAHIDVYARSQWGLPLGTFVIQCAREQRKRKNGQKAREARP